MTRRFALIIDPVGAEELRDDYADTFTRVDAAAPALSVGELSTQRGDGVFESIGVIDGHAQEVVPHLDRLAHSARLCDLPVPNAAQWHQAIGQAAAECGSGESMIKLILSRGVEHGPTPTAWVTVAPAADFATVRANGVRVVTLDRGYDLGAAERAPWLLLGAKTLSYAVNMAALREARRRGADDAIFLSTDGFVLEAPTASVLLREGDRFSTPSAELGILPGTTQRRAFEFLRRLGFETDSVRLRSSELGRADALWLVSSIRRAVPVVELDGVAKAVDTDLTARLNAFLGEH